MTRTYAISTACGLALSFAGCAADIARTKPEAPLAAAYVYRLAPNDGLRISVYGETSLGGEYSVNSEGNISFPLVGMIRAQDKTLGEFSTALMKALQTRYFKDPHVVIDLVASRPIYVLGEVSKAGQFPYQSGMTVLAAVATAGGFTYRANEKIVMIRHAGDAAEKREPLTATVIVEPGDTVRVRERNF